MLVDDSTGFDFDYDNDISVHSDTISISSNINKQRNTLNAYKQTDVDYCKIKRLVNVRTKDQVVPKKVTIEFYSTKTSPGTTIRDAITGARIADHRVGTAHEDLFFKVKLLTGEVKHTTPTMFFDSPEQYERKFGCTVNDNAKQIWRDKNTMARAFFIQNSFD